MKKLFSTLLFLVCFVSPANAATPAPCTRYASPNGTGNGLTQSTPFAIHSFWAVAGPGETLCLLNGTYTAVDQDQTVIYFPTNLSGTSGHPLTVRCLNDGLCDINGQSVNAPIYLSGGNNYINIEGMDAHDSGFGVLTMDSKGNPGSNITIRRVVAWNSKSDNKTNVGSHVIALQYATNIVVEDSAGFGEGRTAGVICLDTINCVVRRVWGMYNVTKAAYGPQKVFMMNYNSRGDLFENNIAQWGPVESADIVSGEKEIADQGDSSDPSVLNRMLGSILMKTVPSSQSMRVWQLQGGAQAKTNIINTVFYNAQSDTIFSALGNCTPVGGCQLSNITEIGNFGNDNIGAGWTISNRLTSASLPTGINNIWNGSSSNGARVCKRYENGVLQDGTGGTINQPLWPWPMDDRIRAALQKSVANGDPSTRNPDNVFAGTAGTGYAEHTVTSNMVSLFGAIPPECVQGVAPPVVTVNITSPTNQPTYTTNSSTINLGGNSNLP